MADRIRGGCRPGGRIRRTTRALALLLVGWALHAAPLAALQRVPDPVAPLDPFCPRGPGWFSRDKACHFVVSGVGAGGLYALGRYLGAPPLPAAIGAALVMGSVGLLRETVAAHDPDQLLTRQNFSRRDMVWNGAGIVVGLAVTDLWLSRRRRAEPPDP
jgi:hypothetical protein